MEMGLMYILITVSVIVIFSELSNIEAVLKEIRDLLKK